MLITLHPHEVEFLEQVGSERRTGPKKSAQIIEGATEHVDISTLDQRGSVVEGAFMYTHRFFRGKFNSTVGENYYDGGTDYLLPSGKTIDVKAPGEKGPYLWVAEHILEKNPVPDILALGLRRSRLEIEFFGVVSTRAYLNAATKRPFNKPYGYAAPVSILSPFKSLMELCETELRADPERYKLYDF